MLQDDYLDFQYCKYEELSPWLFLSKKQFGFNTCTEATCIIFCESSKTVERFALISKIIKCSDFDEFSLIFESAKKLLFAEAYLAPCLTSTMEPLCEIS